MQKTIAKISASLASIAGAAVLEHFTNHFMWLVWLLFILGILGLILSIFWNKFSLKNRQKTKYIQDAINSKDPSDSDKIQTQLANLNIEFKSLYFAQSEQWVRLYGTITSPSIFNVGSIKVLVNIASKPVWEFHSTEQYPLDANKSVTFSVFKANAVSLIKTLKSQIGNYVPISARVDVESNGVTRLFNFSHDIKVFDYESEPKEVRKWMTDAS